MLQDRPQLAQGGYLRAEHAVHHRQEIGGVGELDPGVLALFGDDLVEHRFGFGDNGIRATDRAGCDVFGHDAFSSQRLQGSLRR